MSNEIKRFIGTVTEQDALNNLMDRDILFSGGYYGLGEGRRRNDAHYDDSASCGWTDSSFSYLY